MEIDQLDTQPKKSEKISDCIFPNLALTLTN